MGTDRGGVSGSGFLVSSVAILNIGQTGRHTLAQWITDIPTTGMGSPSLIIVGFPTMTHTNGVGLCRSRCRLLKLSSRAKKNSLFILVGFLRAWILEYTRCILPSRSMGRTKHPNDDTGYNVQTAVRLHYSAPGKCCPNQWTGEKDVLQLD